MRSFAVFTTVFVFAFLTLISALPSGTSSQDINIVAEPLPRGGGYQGIPDCINNANVQVGPLIKDLTASVNVDVSVLLPLAIKVMDEVKVILEDTTHDITIIIKDDPSHALCFNGATVGVSVVVDLLATLCKTLLLVFPVVLKACASVNVKDLLAVMGDVSVDLAGIIKLVSKLVGNIISDLVFSLGAVIPICLELDLTDMIKVLGLVI